jgi:hypothetical protein
MYVSALVLLLFLVLGASPGAAQAVDRPTDPLPTPSEEPASRPLAPIGAVVELDATVVRTSRSVSAPGATGGDMLVRLGDGDTLRVHDVAPLPGVGATVRIRGRIVEDGSAVVMVGEGGTLEPSVLRPGIAWEPSARAESVGRCAEPVGAARAWCAVASFPGWLLALGGLTLLAAIAALWSGFRPGGTGDDSADIPLIVDLGATREAAGTADSVRAAASGIPAPEPTEATERDGRASPPATPTRPEADRSRRSPGQQSDARLPATAHHPPLVRFVGLANGAGVVPSQTEPPGPENGWPPAGAAAPRPIEPAEPVADSARLQLLPGVFEVENGPGLGPELRFFRVSSMEDAVITLGREEGEPYRHVRLDAPTVSRLHARIRFADRRWTIANASAMNPVIVNGEELHADEALALADGDRIRIGEFVFRYRNTRT